MSAVDLRVGALLYPGRPLPEGVVVDASRQWVCIVAINCATPAERSAVARGRVQVSWLLEGPSLLVSVITDALDGVCACSPAERTAPEDVSEDGGALRGRRLRSSRVLSGSVVHHHPATGSGVRRGHADRVGRRVVHRREPRTDLRP